MEYMQMTLDDWRGMKERLKKDLIGVQESFVRIGYTLRKIEEQELFRQDGYETIAEFAKAEYGLSASTVSRFMSINRKYSIDGYSDQLRPEFAQLGSSKLSEMLSLPDGDMEMIKPEATRESIRELKQFAREEPATGVADDIRELIEKFFEINKETLNELFSSEAYVTGEVEKLMEIVNPSGNKTFRKGLYFLMMYENEIKIKKFGMNPQSMPWAEFFSITQEIFGEAAAGYKTWQNYFGGRGDDADDAGGRDTGDMQETDTKEGGKDGTGEKDDAAGEEGSQSIGEGTGAGAPIESAGEESQTEGLAPAQKPAEILEKEPEDETEKEEISRGEPTEQTEEQEIEATAGSETEETEPCPEVMNSPEVMEKPFGSRKDYFDSLTIYGMALEMATLVKDMLNKNLADMTEAGFWEKWLDEEVDEHGRAIEEV